MPVQPCQSGGKPGFKYGVEGKCYPYEPGNKESKKRAYARAAEQGRAIEASRRQEK